MRDLHCSEGTCTLDPPKTILSGGGTMNETDMIDVIPYNQTKSVSRKKKIIVKKALKGSGFKGQSGSHKSKAKLKGQKSGQKSGQKKKISKKQKGKTDFQVLKKLLQNFNKIRK